jgi:hypothetical protein
MKDGTVSDREHVAFLNMWLEKFVSAENLSDPCPIVRL